MSNVPSHLFALNDRQLVVLIKDAVPGISNSNLVGATVYVRAHALLKAIEESLVTSELQEMTVNLAAITSGGHYSQQINELRARISTAITTSKTNKIRTQAQLEANDLDREIVDALEAYFSLSV